MPTFLHGDLGALLLSKLCPSQSCLAYARPRNGCSLTVAPLKATDSEWQCGDVPKADSLPCLCIWWVSKGTRWVEYAWKRSPPLPQCIGKQSNHILSHYAQLYSTSHSSHKTAKMSRLIVSSFWMRPSLCNRCSCTTKAYSAVLCWCILLKPCQLISVN